MKRKLLEGTIVSGGVITGGVRVITNPRDSIQVLPGEIMVVPCSHPEFAIGVMQAGGLVCEQGGIISHICTVALELGIPCVTEVKDATRTLRDHSRITLDGDTGAVYAA